MLAYPSWLRADGNVIFRIKKRHQIEFIAAVSPTCSHKFNLLLYPPLMELFRQSLTLVSWARLLTHTNPCELLLVFGSDQWHWELDWITCRTIQSALTFWYLTRIPLCFYTLLKNILSATTVVGESGSVESLGHSLVSETSRKPSGHLQFYGNFAFYNVPLNI